MQHLRTHEPPDTGCPCLRASRTIATCLARAAAHSSTRLESFDLRHAHAYPLFIMLHRVVTQPPAAAPPRPPAAPPHDPSCAVLELLLVPRHPPPCLVLDLRLLVPPSCKPVALSCIPARAPPRALVGRASLPSPPANTHESGTGTRPSAATRGD